MPYYARMATEEWLEFLKDFRVLRVEKATRIEIIPDLLQDDPQYDGKSLVLLSPSEQCSDLLDASLHNGLPPEKEWYKKFNQGESYDSSKCKTG